MTHYTITSLPQGVCIYIPILFRRVKCVVYVEQHICGRVPLSTLHVSMHARDISNTVHVNQGRMAMWHS